MKIHSESIIPHPRHAVFSTYRDRLSDVASFLPDIESITVLKREEGDGRTTLHNLWVSNADIPAAAGRLLSPEHLRWDDFAVWDHAAFKVSWRLETRVFSEAFSCQGTNTFLEDGAGQTRVVVSGNLALDLSHMPGVPKFIARRIAPQVEAFIVKMITPNLEQVNVAVGMHIDNEGAA